MNSLLRASIVSASLLVSSSVVAQPAPTPIQPGETLLGDLSTTDARSSDRMTWVDHYTISLEAGATIRVDLAAGFDTYLYLRDENGFVIAQDDDGGEGLNARLVARVPRTGTYTIEATSFSEATGPYQLSTRVITNVGPIPTSLITPGQRVAIHIDESSGLLAASLDAAHAVRFEGQAGNAYRLRFASERPARVRVIGPDGFDIRAGHMHDYQTYGGGGLGEDALAMSEQILVLPYAGAYRIIVASAESTEAIVELLPWEAGATEVPLVESGSTRSGTLSASSSTDLYGRSSDRFRVAVRAGQRIEVDVECPSCSLTLIGSGITQTESYSDGQRASTAALATRDGEVIVSVAAHLDLSASSSWPGPIGMGGATQAWTARVNVGAAVAPRARRIRVGDTVTGALETGDAQALAGAGFVDVYELDVRDPGPLQVEVTAPGVSASIMAPTGESIGELMGDFTGSAAIWSGAMPVRGTYLISVRGGSATTSTPYTLGVRTFDPGRVARIAPGASTSGTFRSGANPMYGTAAQDTVELEVAAPARVRVTARRGAENVSITFAPISGDAWRAQVELVTGEGSVDVSLLPGIYQVNLMSWMGGGGWTLETEILGEASVTLTTLVPGQRLAGPFRSIAGAPRPTPFGITSGPLVLTIGPGSRGSLRVAQTAQLYLSLSGFLFDENGESVEPITNADNLTWQLGGLAEGTYLLHLTSWDAQSDVETVIEWLAE